MLVCSVVGCEKPVCAKTYCEAHYKRFKRHGDPLIGRPSHWGLKEKHPLNHSYMWFKRNNLLCEEWLDFWIFVKAVGDKKENYSLRRRDKTKILSPENFYWKETISCPDHNKRMRDWNKANPEKVRNSYYKKSFGITLDQYNEILEKQGGVCAICNEKDSNFVNLAVDHDHNTNKVRGLLCHLCNRALGMFKDDIIRIKNAIMYLNTKE